MIPWLDSLAEALAGRRDAIAVTVVGLKGSGPREPGARMVVTEGGLAGTIGGGELEWRALATAREMLAGGAGGRVLAMALGPELGQCCGGRVTLAFEPFAPSDLAWVRRLAAAAGEPGGAGRTLTISAAGAVAREIVGAPAAPFAARCEAGGVTLTERVAADLTPLWLFGAGHVGRALVRALTPLPFAITWIDGREDAFGEGMPEAVRTLALAMPELAVEEAPPGAMFLVMTHSHPLDEEICAAVLARPDFAYLGLIGSASKQARFRQRLARRGIGEAALARLHGPIGLAGIPGKDPATIAASVAADLLGRRAGRHHSFPAHDEADSSDVRRPRNA